MKRTLLIDADIYCYKHSSRNESVFYFDGKDNPPAVEHDTQAACEGALEDIESIRKKLDADRIIICLTDREQPFRKEIYPDYKGNRTSRKPEDLFRVEAFLKERYEFYRRDGLEADDCMGILSTHPTIVPGEKIIVSEDKDMQTIPGLLFNPRKDDDVRKVSRLQADRFHMVQTITGDQTDHYPGAVGIGPDSPEVSTVNTAKTVKEMWQAVRCAYIRSSRKADMSAYRRTYGKSKKAMALFDFKANLVAIETRAVIQARCARILRASDWNFAERKPILWVPPRID